MGAELFESLSALVASAGNRPCAPCDEPSGEDTIMSQELFASAGESGSEDLVAQLESALSNLSSESAEGAPFDPLSLEEQLEFAAFGDENTLTLEDLLAFAERHPGLKITFSY